MLDHRFKKGLKEHDTWNKIRLMSDPEENNKFVFPRVLMCPTTSSRETPGLERKKKTNWYPVEPEIKCFVIFLDFPFNVLSSTATKEYALAERLKTVDSVLIRTQFLFSKPLNEWFSKYFPYIICIFSLHTLLVLFWDNFENRFFLAWGFMFVLLCSFTKKKPGSVFLACCHATFHHALITCCINVSRAGKHCQPRPQGLLAFQYGGGRREDPGTLRTKTIVDWCISWCIYTCALIGLL